MVVWGLPQEMAWAVWERFRARPPMPEMAA
jgi:hypothetical protein